jgi:hypothetical protein
VTAESHESRDSENCNIPNNGVFDALRDFSFEKHGEIQQGDVPVIRQQRRNGAYNDDGSRDNK